MPHETDTVISFPDQSGLSADPLTALARDGARQLIAQALEAEIAELLAQHQDLTDDIGRQRLVRHGSLPERSIQTGIGPVPVKVPRMRDRGNVPADEKIRFSSSLLPPYLRRTKSMEELIPWLYLKGISTGDFTEALGALVGRDAPGLSSSTVSRLTKQWQAEFQTWRTARLSEEHYVYIWADGIYLTPRMGERQCLLVVMGADAHGRKDILAISDGYRESTDSWREVLLDLKARGLTTPPKLAIADGAMGFWAAVGEVYPETKTQRCWFHKMGNVLNAMPKSLQKRAKEKLHDIWQAETKKDAEKAFDLFVETYGVKYPKAAGKLTKDRDTLLTFYDFPAEHWCHVRTTNPIESTFATIRHRTTKTKGCLSRETALAMIFQLVQSAKKKWRKLNAADLVVEVISGVEFKDGIKQTQTNAA